jgi:hypothetical protein
MQCWPGGQTYVRRGWAATLGGMSNETPLELPSPNQRMTNLIDSVIGGLIANAITATFVFLVAVAGGRLKVMVGVTLIVFSAYSSVILAAPFIRFRNIRTGTAVPNATINLPKEIAGSVGFVVVCLLPAIWFLGRLLAD